MKRGGNDITLPTDVAEEGLDLLKVKPANHFVSHGLRLWIWLIIVVLCSVFLVGGAELSVDILRDEIVPFDLGSGSTQQNEGGGSCFVNTTYRSFATEFESGIATIPARAWTSPGGQCEGRPASLATIVFEKGSPAAVPNHLQSIFDGNDLIDDSLVSRDFALYCKTLADEEYIYRHAILVKPTKDTSLLDGSLLEKDQFYLVLSRSSILGYCIFKRVSGRSSLPSPNDNSNNGGSGDGGGDDDKDDKDDKDDGLDGGEVAGIVVGGLVGLTAAVIAALALRKWGPTAAERLRRKYSNNRPNSNEQNGSSSQSPQLRPNDRDRDHHSYAQQNANGPQNSVSNIFNFGNNQNVASH